MQRRNLALAAAGLMGLTASCQDFLDVNTNPNGPETVSANVYIAPMLHWMTTSQYWDGRAIAQYTQQLTQNGASTYDLMGPNRNTDLGGEQWKTTYFVLGENVIDMMNIAQAEERWDILGLGYTLKAWGWLGATSLHGPIVLTQAFDRSRFSFDYDPQEMVYPEVFRLLDSAIVYLSRTDGQVNASYMARGDKMYNGNREKWLRYAHGLYAMSLNHLSGKSSYDPAAVIAHVDQSFASSADDALWTFGNTIGEDRNFLGRGRGNYTGYRQTEFVLGLLSGSALGVQDPRMTRMLAPSPNGWYVGVDPLVSYLAMPDSIEPNNPHGYPASGGIDLPQLYVFADRAKAPAMTYSQLQFVKAEAAYHMGNRTLALAAYRNGIVGHFDFVNARNTEGGLGTPITTAERNAFLANPLVVPTNPANLTLQMIMSQKYIAQWGWGHNELWTDMRRYDYIGLDPVTGQPIYPGFFLPTTLHSSNQGKPVYRLLPRYNSEYVWNQEGLDKIGGLAPDYHTVPTWITTP